MFHINSLHIITTVSTFSGIEVASLYVELVFGLYAATST